MVSGKKSREVAPSVRCRLHEQQNGRDCRTECHVVERITRLEERIGAIRALAEHAIEAIRNDGEGILSDVVAFDTISLLAKSIHEDEDLFGYRSRDTRLNQPALRFLEALGLIGQDPDSGPRLVPGESTESKIRRAS